ncbi:MAG TPA: response regulator, partial [Pirellulales bacterium]|nr:response regulator [Pirellulales bacterium]
LFELLADSHGILVWTADARGRLVDLQSAWKEFTGQPWRSHRNHGWLDAFHVDDRQKVYDQWQHALAASVNCQVQARLWHEANQRYHHVDIRAVALKNSDGTIREWVAVARDAESEVANAAAAAKAIELAARIKNELLANVSHEFRTPIYGIVGMTELALEEELAPTVRDYLQTARNSAEVLLRLVNEILDFSRLESGKFRLEPRAFRLRPLLIDTLKSLDASASEKGLEVSCDVTADVPNALVGDALRLRQVLFNLLNNAIKFSSQGRIILRAARVADPSEGPLRLRFDVIDQGIGISEADQRRIFDPFAQVDASTTRQQSGTGLGLTIANELIHLMGGHIGVQSTPGHGSTFSFDVTLGEDHAEPADCLQGTTTAGTAAHPAPSAATVLKVLLAEDTPATQKIVKKILTKRGHQVQIACNGREVVKMIQTQPFDVVLMDVQMPGMDGLQATAAIRGLEHELGQRVPIVAMTAHAMHGDRERCLAAGMDGYLAKPVSQANLIETVETISMSERSMPERKAPSNVNSLPRFAATEVPTVGEPFDLHAALSRLGQDRRLFEDL